MNLAEREEWLASRRSGVGASEVAAVCGHCPYRGPFEVYLSKRGYLQSEQSEEMHWGYLLEPVVAKEFARRKGVEVLVPGSPLFRHPRFDFCIATPDRLIADSHRLLECKTSRTSEFWGAQGTDQIPDGYLLQCQWQMLACAQLQIEAVEVAVLIGGSDFRTYTVYRHVELQERLLQTVGDFWANHVLAEVPPPLAFDHPKAVDLINLIFRPEPGTCCELNDYAQQLADRYEDLGSTAKQLDRARDAAKAELLCILGTHEYGILPDGRQVCKKLSIVAPEKKPRDGYEKITFSIKKGRSA